MDIQQYFKLVSSMMLDHPDWRYGQCLFNALYRMDPEAANRIRATQYDPFYSEDSVCVDFWIWFGGHYEK